MNLTEFRNHSYVALGDFERMRNPALIDFYVNQGHEKFCQSTQILRTSQKLPVVRGMVDLRPSPDSVILSGRIIRVEDAATGQVLDKMRIGQMDALGGPDWRSQTIGQLKGWAIGMPEQPLVSESEQDGYSTLLVYPAVSSASINVYYTASPIRLVDDSEESSIPDHFHFGIVFYVVWAILTAEGDQAKQSLAAFAKGQYDDYIAQAKAEVAEWGGPVTTAR